MGKQSIQRTMLVVNFLYYFIVENDYSSVARLLIKTVKTRLHQMKDVTIFCTRNIIIEQAASAYSISDPWW